MTNATLNQPPAAPTAAADSASSGWATRLLGDFHRGRSC